VFSTVLTATLIGLVAAPGWAVSVTRGPFLQLQEPDSIHVVWWTDTACTGEVEWGLTAGYGNVTASAESVTRHEIAITGLTPDTLYYYRVRHQGAPLGTGATFRTAVPAGVSGVSFAFVGDSCSAPGNATATYNAMLPHSVNGFCVTLGDLAGRGEDNLTDYWQSHFFSPAGNFIKQIAMYPCIGNHEIYDESSYPGFVYPTKYLANWSLPTASSGTELYYSFDKGPVHFVSVDTWWTSFVQGSPQYNWLASDLAATTRSWKIAFAHTGPYISQFGTTDGSSTVRTALVPLFEQRNVDLYLHGHYHDYQRNDINGVTYIVQGTGGQSLTQRADDSQPYVQAYAGGEYCFTRLDIDGNRLLGRCIKTSDGTVIDGFQMDKPPISLPWQDTFPAAGQELNWIAPWNFAGQCGLVAQPGNPSGDGNVFAVGDTSGHQFAYPMLAGESLTSYSLQAQVFYDAASPVKTRVGIGARGRQLFTSSKRSYYGLFLVRNDPPAVNGDCLLVRQDAGGTETVLAEWPGSDVSGWHKLKLSVAGSELTVWIDEESQTATAITDGALAKGRPFIYNYRATGSGAKTLVDDVLIASVTGPALITDFEGYADGAQVMFRQPSFSGSTSGHLAASPNASGVVTASAFGGSKVCQVDWAFVDTDPKRWLRLTTSGVANVGNPTVDLDRPITFRYRLATPGSLRMCLGIRETGVDVPIGTNGGTSGLIEWLGANSVVNGTPQGRLISDAGGQWQQITFDPLVDPVQAFTGDGVLDASNRRGVLEHLALAIVDGAGPWSLQLDLFEQPWRDPVTPPVISQHPSPQTVCPDRTVTFTVEASGSSPMSFQWQKDGVDIADGGSYGGTATSVLSISGVESSHAGTYRCQVTNAAGIALSSGALLAVRIPTTITDQPQSRQVFAGQTASFTVAATGDGMPSLQWQKDGVDLVNDSRISGATTWTLTLSSVTGTDAGNYRCEVTGPCRSETSQEAYLTVDPAFYGDFDYDGDVDQEDFGYLQACLNRQTEPVCYAANLDGSSTIDQQDLVLFVDCMSGPGGTPPPYCLK
jgi:hypothetical protein